MQRISDVLIKSTYSSNQLQKERLGCSVHYENILLSRVHKSTTLSLKLITLISKVNCLETTYVAVFYFMSILNMNAKIIFSFLCVLGPVHCNFNAIEGKSDAFLGPFKQ